MQDFNFAIQALVWVRWAIQNWALAKQTRTVLRACNIEATSIVAVRDLGLRMLLRALYVGAGAFSVACQGLVLFRLHRKPKEPILEPAAAAGAKP